jgi:hypothetical protein
MRFLHWTLGLCAVSALTVAGCSGSGSGVSSEKTGTVNVLATDAPFVDFGEVSEAMVVVDRIQLRVASDDPEGEGELLTIFEDVDNPHTLNLVELTNGITESLASAEVPTGNYDQLRLRIPTASLTVGSGESMRTFTHDDGTVQLASVDTSGWKLDLDPPLAVVDGFSSSLLVDIAAPQTFLPVPPSAPLTEAVFLRFGPVGRLANLSTTGDMEGTVTFADSEINAEAPSVTVVVLVPGGNLDVDADVVTATLTGDGSGEDDVPGGWAVLGLDPGTYDLVAMDGAHQVRVDGQLVVAGSRTVVDLELPGSPPAP